MYESGDGIYFCSSGALFLSYDKRKRGVCDQSDDRKIDKSDRLLWSCLLYTSPSPRDRGVRSGENVDKWKECRHTQGKASSLEFAPIIEESPVNIECKVKKMEELGSHHMFLAEVTAVQVDDSYMDDNGKFMLNNTGLIAYSHGEYLSLGEKLGQFGYSVRKKKKQTKKKSGMK